MYLRRILYGDAGKIFISIILGLGLATLFRKVCNDRNCIIFKAPDIKKIQNCTSINFFPNQATETVRLDEAILGTLSILNIFSINYT